MGYIYKILITYLAFINVALFALMWLDKRAAQKKARRVPEIVLLSIAAAGGAIGGLAGMFTFHHKTRKSLFVFGMSVMIACHGIICLALFT